MNIKLGALVLLLGTLALQGCSSRETPLYEPAEEPSVQNQVNLKKVWSKSIKEVKNFFPQTELALTSNSILQSSLYGEIVSYDKKTGKRLAHVELKSHVKNEDLLFPGALTVADNYVLIGSEDGLLSAVDLQNDRLAWSVDAKGPILVSPLVVNNVAYVLTANGLMKSYDVQTGQLKWGQVVDLPNKNIRGLSQPVYAAGSILVGETGGYIRALSYVDGQLQGRYFAGKSNKATNEFDSISDVDARALVTKTKVIAFGYAGGLVAYDYTNPATAVWSLSESGVRNVAYDGVGTLFLVNNFDELLAVNERTGKVLWKNSQLKHRKLSELALVNGKLAVGDYDGRLYLLSQQNGNIIAKETLSSAILATPIFDNGMLFVKEVSGKLTAFQFN